MPELPDVTVYVDCLKARVVGAMLAKVRVKSPFLLRTFEPPAEHVEGRRVVGVERLGKRIVFEFEGRTGDAVNALGGPVLALHLMIAGRLLWKPPGTKPGGKIDLASFEFDGGPESGVLLLTEAGTKKRAAMHVFESRAAMMADASVNRGGVEPMSCSLREFGEAMRKENRTVKRVLTSPTVFSGIGNAYSDEILHAAKMSPFKKSGQLDDEEMARLHKAVVTMLAKWTRELRAEFGLDPETGAGPGRFPGVGKITAFRPGFAVHGKFGKPCPVCGTKVQRVVFAENEMNYCPTCQTEGRVLADRSMSRLLRDEWPKTVEELE